MAESPLLAQIRVATRALHDRVEQVPLMARLLAPDLRADEYRAVLLRMWGFYEPLEARFVSPVPHAFTPRTPRLEADLGVVGVPDALPPRCTHLPDVSTEARAWGCLYVLEGATLGGRVLLKHLSRSLGVTPDQGGSFFAGAGPAGASWKAFLTGLAAFEARTAEAQPTVEAAVDTFDTLYQWLQV